MWSMRHSIAISTCFGPPRNKAATEPVIVPDLIGRMAVHQKPIIFIYVANKRFLIALRIRWPFTLHERF